MTPIMSIVECSLQLGQPWSRRQQQGAAMPTTPSRSYQQPLPGSTNVMIEFLTTHMDGQLVAYLPGKCIRPSNLQRRGAICSPECGQLTSERLTSRDRTFLSTLQKAAAVRLKVKGYNWAKLLQLLYHEQASLLEHFCRTLCGTRQHEQCPPGWLPALQVQNPIHTVAGHELFNKDRIL
jgi:hypothetical protein